MVLFQISNQAFVMAVMSVMQNSEQLIQQEFLISIHP